MTRRPLAVFALAMLGLALDIWLLFNLRQAGLPVSFAFGLAAAVVLFVTAASALSVMIRPTLKVIASLTRSAANGLSKDRYVRRLAISYPTACAWLSRRFASGLASGRMAAQGATGFIWRFISVGRFSYPVTQASVRSATARRSFSVGG